MDSSSTSAPESQDSTTDSDIALAAMDFTETPDDPVRTHSSKGPPARKATAPYPVSNPRKKSSNPPPS